jgi:hypothetical protein
LYGLYGTGFAQPNAIPVVKIIIIGKITEPIGSICRIGSKDNLPAFFAV